MSPKLCLDSPPNAASLLQAFPSTVAFLSSVALAKEAKVEAFPITVLTVGSFFKKIAKSSVPWECAFSKLAPH